MIFRVPYITDIDPSDARRGPIGLLSGVETVTGQLANARCCTRAWRDIVSIMIWVSQEVRR